MPTWAKWSAIFLSVLLLVAVYVRPVLALTDAPEWGSVGPYGGAVTALAIDPLTPATLYAGTYYGVYKTTNGGAQWSRAVTGLPTQTDMDALVVDPQTPATLYAGYYFAGMFKSTNGGASWGAVNTGLSNLSVISLAIDPQSPATLYAGTQGGVFKSTNGGASWSAANVGLSNLYVSDLAINPKTPATLYAGTQSGVFKSANGGASWGVVNLGPTILYAGGLAIDPQTPTTLYVFSAAGVHKSVDGGQSWSGAATGWPYTFVNLTTLVIDPQTPTTLYAGSWHGAYKSVDGGASWSEASADLTDLFVDALVIDPQTPTILYAGTSKTAVSKSTDGGANWSVANTGLTSIMVKALAIDPQTPATLYAGLNNEGVFKSTDAGVTWSAANTGLGNPQIWCLAIDPLSPATLYACTSGSGSGASAFKSTNGGASWSEASSGLTHGPPQALAIDPQTPTTLYAGTNGGGVFKSTDGGASWIASSTGLTEFVSALAIDPQTPSTLYAGGWGAGVYKSTDGGTSWSTANAGLSCSVSALAIDRQTPSTLYAGGCGVFKSVDGGAHWDAANIGMGAQSVMALAIDPHAPSILYAGTSNGGVFRSVTGGGSWSAANTGLTNLDSPVLAVDPQTPTTLYVGTVGGGIFKSTNDLSATTTPWTLMFYLAEDNDIEELLADQLSLLKRASDSTNVNIVVFVDTKATDTRYLVFSPHGLTMIGKGELSTGDPDVLREFITWTQANYPASHYALTIVDHGQGHTGVAFDDDAPGDLKDCNGRSCLTLSEFQTAVTGLPRIDVLNMVACTMATIEAEYQLRDRVGYYVASQQVMWVKMHPEWWTLGHRGQVRTADVIIPAISDATLPEDLAVAMAQSYYLDVNTASAAHPATISAVRLDRVESVRRGASALAGLLKAEMVSLHEIIKGIRTDVQRFDSDGDLEIEGSDELIDLYDFAQLVDARIDQAEVKASAQSVISAIESYTIRRNQYPFAWSGEFDYRGKQHTWSLGNSHGVSIFFPDYSRSFYKGNWFDFAAGTTWDIMGVPRAQEFDDGQIGQSDTTEWGPMLVEYVRETNPSAPDNPNPPELIAPLIPPRTLFLPLLIRQ